MKAETLKPAITFLILLLSIGFVIIASQGGVFAEISKDAPGDYCDLCHSNCDLCHLKGRAGDGTSNTGCLGPHNSDRLLKEQNSTNLLITNTGCLGCHSSDSGESIKILGDTNTGIIKVPVIHNTSSPENSLAGGNFWWMESGYDAMGHNCNVPGISNGTDETFIFVPGFKGLWDLNANPLTCAGTYGCHGMPVTKGEGEFIDQWEGIKGAHHSNKGGDRSALSEINTVGGSYRFLVGIAGYEDPDWQHPDSLDETHHNEYKGSTSESDTTTISSLCARCHGYFHSDSYIGDRSIGGPWLRHPTDISLPGSTTEYASYNAPEGAMRRYSIIAPVGRRNVISFASSTVDPEGNMDDIITCISCHRAHGSDQPDLLRWRYDAIVSGSGAGDIGCTICHTEKSSSHYSTELNCITCHSIHGSPPYYITDSYLLKEGIYFYYLDADNDKYGDPLKLVVSTSAYPPPGHVQDNTDCDDSNNSVNPGAEELCDGKDTDCDGVAGEDEIDTDSDGVLVCAGDCNDSDPRINPDTRWYQDADGDTYGNPNVIKIQCTQPEGYVLNVLNALDCDDENPYIHPRAIEIFNSTDNDCDKEVDEPNDLTNGLLAYYTFNGNANNDNRNVNQGEVNGAKLTQDMFGNPNAAYSFDGINDYIEVHTSFDYTTFTIGAWIFIEDYKGYGGILDAYKEKWEFVLDYPSGNRLDFIQWKPEGSYNEYASVNTILSRHWYYVAVVISGDSGTISINGKTDSSFKMTDLPITGVTDFIIGASLSGRPQYFKGIIDELRIYNRALSESEIRELAGLCEGDFNGDGDVDGSDLAVFITDFGRTDCKTGPPCKGDFDSDSDVDGTDLAIFVADYGRIDCPLIQRSL